MQVSGPKQGYMTPYTSILPSSEFHISLFTHQLHCWLDPGSTFLVKSMLVQQYIWPVNEQSTDLVIEQFLLEVLGKASKG